MEKTAMITVARSDQINCKLLDLASVRWLSRILHQTDDDDICSMPADMNFYWAGLCYFSEMHGLFLRATKLHGFAI